MSSPVLLLVLLGIVGSGDSLGPHPVRREFGLRVRMRDGAVLVADAYRPDGPGRFPVILVRTPYTRTLLGHYHQGHYWASHGYGYGVQDVRGRGDSDGVFEPLVHEARDG